MKILVTGGSGFIGSSLIRYLINETDNEILNLDKLTYASSLNSLSKNNNNSNYQFIKGDICNRELVNKIFFDFNPNAVMHLAAETHVDRSIKSPFKFIQTNVFGTYVMLDCALKYWNSLSIKNNFRFLHISTDEVYGSLNNNIDMFTEKTPYKPNSPYSASKASSDHFVRAWNITYGLPILITNCSNNYGPYQFPEKLIPLIILNALDNKTLPIYGDGQQIRDWLHVDDHSRALYEVLNKGKLGETYNIGGYNERKNIQVVNILCEMLDRLYPDNLKRINSYKNLIEFVSDRPGHDRRYAIDSSKIKKDIGWEPIVNFETGLFNTVKWYLKNLDWCKKIKNSI